MVVVGFSFSKLCNLVPSFSPAKKYLSDLVTWPISNKMAAINALAAYGDDSDSEENESTEEEITPNHTTHLSSKVSITQLQSKIQLKSAPEVTAKVGSSISTFHTIKFYALSTSCTVKYSIT